MRQVRSLLTMKQITIGDIGNGPRVFGLGHDNKVYYWTPKGWVLLV